MSNRYIRQLQLPELGAEAQQRLGAARAVVVGCGALGSVAAMYLAGAGVGHITIADYDTVDLSNLHRQLFFAETDCGKPKAILLKQRMEALNSDIRVVALNEMIRPDRLRELAAQADVVLDATDNPDSKYMVSDVCATLPIPCITGGVKGWQGQVMTCVPGMPYYRDVFPESDSTGFTPCSIAGIIGPAAGAVAALQSAETIKLLAKAGKTLAGRLLLLDTLTMTMQEIELRD